MVELPVRKLFGVKIPLDFRGSLDDARLYAAGYLWGTGKVPSRLAPIQERLGEPDSDANIRDSAGSPYTSGYLARLRQTRDKGRYAISDERVLRTAKDFEVQGADVVMRGFRRDPRSLRRALSEMGVSDDD